MPDPGIDVTGRKSSLLNRVFLRLVVSFNVELEGSPIGRTGESLPHSQSKHGFLYPQALGLRNLKM